MNYQKLFKRNIGFISEKEQKKLAQTSISIAGLGADGGLLAERLVRFGIGKFVLADPDAFEPSNTNRQFGANFKTFGKNKAKVIARELTLINPKIKITIFDKGVNKFNVSEFVKKSDIVVDEIEYLNHEISILLAQEARKQNKYLFMGANIGWGASIFCFSPKGMTLEKYFQYDPKTKKINLIRYVKKVPSYFNKNLLKKVISRKIPIPSLSSSVGLTSSLLTNEIILFIIKKRKPIIAPKFLFFDNLNLKLEKR
ncbi:MAG: ThiF family adenylyltransferase [Minisyncoccales bacterium]